MDPSRLTAAKEAAASFVENLPAAFRVGLIAFSTDARLVVAPTADRAEILAALFNGVTLVAVSAFIFIEAIDRLADPPEVSIELHPFTFALKHRALPELATALSRVGAGICLDFCHFGVALGRELDSLSDVISFGVAPAALGFAAGLQGGWDVAALIYFVCCGVSRLARYNVTAESLSAGADKVAYFEGTPIPTSVVLTGVLAFAAWQDRLGEALWGGALELGPWQFHPLALLFVLSGSLMISKTLRIPKL